MKRGWFCFAMAFLFGCSETNLGRKEQTDYFLQEPISKVDILWVVDNSPSMVEEQQKVANGFDLFISHIEKTNIDFQIGVITTDMDDKATRGRLIADPVTGIRIIVPETPDYQEVFRRIVQVGIEGSGWEKGLEAARYALTEPMISTENAGFLREDATLSIIVVSDENDCSDNDQLPGEDQIECYEMWELLVPVAYYVDAFWDLKADDDDVIFSCIVGPRNEEKSCPDTAPGSRYMEVASYMNGLSKNICAEDYSSIMDDLGLSTAGRQVRFPLSRTPDPETIKVWVDNVPVEEDPDQQNGWTYSADDNSVYFWGPAIPPYGSSIAIYYEVIG